MTKNYNEVGRCPKCGDYNIVYFELELLDDFIYYPAICNKCGQEFKEFYKLQFDTIEME